MLCAQAWKPGSQHHPAGSDTLQTLPAWPAPVKLLEQSKRAKYFINSKGLPRYCSVTTQADGRAVLVGGRSRRGKKRGPPGSKDWAAALKGCEDYLFIEFLKRCLHWDPSARLTPAQALRHPWISKSVPRPLTIEKVSKPL